MMVGRRSAVAAFPRRLESNPYCELLYDHLERLGVEVVDGRSGVRWLVAHRGRVGVLHFHWPERHFRRGAPGAALGFAARLLLARALGYRIVWTVHNLAPHEDAAGDRIVRAVLERVATLVVHCEAGREELVGRRAVVIPHGSYVGRYPNGITPAMARARLGLEPQARVLVSFGQIRPYKGLGELLGAFAGLAAPHARLVIAGRPVGPDDTLRDAAVDERVRLHLRHVPDAEVQVFLNAADLVVLPYRAVLTSGAAMLALSFGRGIVAPRVGCLADFERTGAAILYDPAAPDGLPGALARALDADPVALGERARRFARSLSWEAIARRHLGVYGFAPSLTVLARRAGRTQAGRARSSG
jgi:beta-1,4-mannosyltransferase